MDPCASMTLTMLSLFLCLFFLNGVICPPLDLTAEIDKFFQGAGISNPSSKEIAVARKLIIRVDEERERADMYNRQLVRVELEKFDVEKYRNILIVLTRIEHLERRLCPLGNNPRTRYERWVRILNSGDPEANIILQRILAEYKSNDVDLCISTFAKALQDIYGELSDAGFHDVFDHNVLDKLSKGDDELAKQMLSVMRVKFDEVYVKALRVISKPLPIPNNTMNSEPKYKEITCVVIQPLKGKFDKESVTEDDVHRFFPLNKPEVVKMYEDEAGDCYEIIAKFENDNAAVEAYNNNHGWLNKIKVQMTLSKCKETTSDLKYQ